MNEEKINTIINERFKIKTKLVNVCNSNLTDYLQKEFDDKKLKPVFPQIVHYDYYSNPSLCLVGHQWNKDSIYNNLIDEIVLNDKINWLTDYAFNEFTISDNEYNYIDIKKMHKYGMIFLDKLVKEHNGLPLAITHSNMKKKITKQNYYLFFKN